MQGRGLDRLPAPGDRAGHLPGLQDDAAVRAPQAAVRHRPGRQVVPQRDHARQLHLPHARVRADGDGVLRAARRGRAVARALARAAAGLVRAASGSTPSACACARTTPTSCRITPRRPATSSTSTRSAGRSSRASPTAATSTSRSTLCTRARSSSTSTRRPSERYVPHVIEPAAGRRPDAARPALRRLRRGRPRRGDAHRPAPAPGARAREGRGPARCCARTATPSSRARSTRSCASHDAEYDEGGAIGRRYRRQDEIGTPFAVTVDHQSVEDRTVTLRDEIRSRRSACPIDALAGELEARLR